MSYTDTILTGREDFETFVEKVTQSRTLTVLWNRHAAMQGWSSWDDLDKGNLCATLQRFRQVQEAYLAGGWEKDGGENKENRGLILVASGMC